MGRKRHSLGKEFSKNDLKKLCDEVYKDDGGRFAGETSTHTHKGLPPKNKDKEKYKHQKFEC